MSPNLFNFLWDLSLTCLVSDEGEQLWVWQYETEDGKHDLFMDVGEEIRSVLIMALFTLQLSLRRRKPDGRVNYF